MINKRLISLLFKNNNNYNIKISWFLLIFNILVIINLCNGVKLSLDNYNVPCRYSDTVDLRNSTKLSNGSYIYGDIVIPNQYIGLYDYELLNNTYRISVPLHPRGCACSLTSKKCLRWCCDNGQMFSERGCVKINETYTNELTIVDYNGNNITTDIYNYFIPQMNYRPCDDMYFLERDYPGDEYILYEDGSLKLLYDERIVDKSSMCFGYAMWENESVSFYPTAYLCRTPQENSLRMVLNAFAMLFSIPFMIITVLVYTLIPELRNLHGKSLACYLLGLIFGYSLLCCQIFFKELNTLSCYIIGFVAYFSFMSAFFWLSVISFDLWWNFRGTHGRNLRDSKKFYIFALYAWGLAATCTGITIIAQLTDYLPQNFKPGIGDEDYCWLDVLRNYSAFAYFYGPILAIITFNIIMFIITSTKIHHVQREVARMIAREDSRKNLRTEKDQYGLFLRLFIVMGATWSMEIISYLVGEKHIFAWIFYVMDVCNAVQGFLIFALFVLKKKVKHLIIKSTFDCPLKAWLISVSLKSASNTVIEEVEI
ncbi:G-protein coupled receptor Mth2-like isoform X2 [Condylostylus longicornis]|uniref:G-protein coupled receptor Mth2-like isoform X2 n=1 Tax=Condylostylus longicornis TaxID=2530218 RepID=UPI00244DF661|nr:G-protein coupled receptor Mth2-like isoform X2 [Condylostylus longicornis]